MRTRAIIVKVPFDMIRGLDAVCKQRSWGRSTAIRDAIREYLQRRGIEVESDIAIYKARPEDGEFEI